MYRFRSLILAAFISFGIFAVLSGCDEVVETEPDPEDPSEEIEQLIQQSYLGEEVTDFQVLELDVQGLFDELESGEVTLPVITPANDVAEVTTRSELAGLLSEEADQGAFRSGEPTQAEIEEVPLPSEQSFLLGTIEEAPNEPAGGLTVLDDAHTLAQGVVMHPENGLSFIEPVNLVLQTDEYRGWHVVYNIENTVDVPIDEDEVFLGGEGNSSAQPPSMIEQTSASTEAVLDGDVEFYEWNEDTVWRRQRSLFLMPQLTYALVEPFASGGVWQLIPRIKGQEVWVSGGPTTTDKAELLETISDDDYFMLHSVADDEIHPFFVGYDVNGAAGRAWIGSTNNGIGTHSWNEAAGLHSLRTKQKILTHEVGHNLGGIHGNSITSGCSGSKCGRSIMNGTITPSSDFFFSDDNDDRIEGVISSVY